MDFYYGLRGLKSARGYGDYIDCPKCRNELTVAMNGFLNGQVFYCHKEKRVFNIQIKEIKTSPELTEFIDQCEKDINLEEIRKKITLENLEAVKLLLKDIK